MRRSKQTLFSKQITISVFFLGLHECRQARLFNRVPRQHSIMVFRSDCHEIFTEKLTKTSLSPYDDKRFILEDGVKTLAHAQFP